MAWIESHQSLAQHPKTRKLARLLNVPIPQAIGHLHMLWWWALDYAQEGDLDRYEDADIADAVLWDGSPSLLMASLLDARFLDQPAGKPCIHDWDLYGGKLISRRKADAARKPKTGLPTDIHENSNGSPLDIQRSPRVEKSREEKSTESSSGAVAPKPRRRAITDADVTRWEGEHPSVDIRAMVKDYDNWTGSSKHTDKVLGFENQLRDGWRLEKFRKPLMAAVGQNVNAIHQRNLDLERIAWERKNPGVPFE